MSRGRRGALRIGEIEYPTAHHLYVVKLEVLPRIGERLFDSKNRPIGVVKDIIGSVRKPYAIISTDNLKIVLGQSEPLFCKR